MCDVWVKRGGILAPFEVPELTLDHAIDRGWVRREDGRLLEPKPEERGYLRTVPGTAWETWDGENWYPAPARIPWRNQYEYPTGPFITGLPEI